MVTQASSSVKVPGTNQTPKGLWDILHGGGSGAMNPAVTASTSTKPYTMVGTNMAYVPSADSLDNILAGMPDTAARDRTAIRRRVLPGRTTAWTPEAEVVKDAAYYEALAAQRLGGSDWEGLRNRSEESVAQADARVRAMYRTLRAEQDRQKAETEASRTAAGENLEASADKAAADIEAAYANAQQQQADLTARLGVEEAFPAATTMAEGSARNQAVAELAGQSATNANTADLNSQLEYQRGQQDALGLEGATVRSGFQSDLLNRLAELDFQASQEARNLPGERLAMAQQLRSWDQSFEPQGLTPEQELAALEFGAGQESDQRAMEWEVYSYFYDKTNDAAQAAELTNQYMQQKGL